MRRVGFLVLFAMSTSAFAVTGPQIEFQRSSVVATGVGAGSKVVFFGVARERVLWLPELLRWATVVTAAADGRAVLDLGRDVPPGSVWTVVEIATGDYAMGAPPMFPWPGATQLPAASFAASHGKGRGVVHLPVRRVEVVVVRPGVGAWRARGGAAQPAVGGGMAVDLLDLQPLDNAPAGPAGLVARDLFLAVDPTDFRSFVHHAGP